MRARSRAVRCRQRRRWRTSSWTMTTTRRRRKRRARVRAKRWSLKIVDDSCDEEPSVRPMPVRRVHLRQGQLRTKRPGLRGPALYRLPSLSLPAGRRAVVCRAAAAQSQPAVKPHAASCSPHRLAQRVRARIAAVQSRGLYSTRPSFPSRLALEEEELDLRRKRNEARPHPHLHSRHPPTTQPRADRRAGTTALSRGGSRWLDSRIPGAQHDGVGGLCTFRCCGLHAAAPALLDGLVRKHSASLTRRDQTVAAMRVQMESAGSWACASQRCS